MIVGQLNQRARFCRECRSRLPSPLGERGWGWGGRRPLSGAMSHAVSSACTQSETGTLAPSPPAPLPEGRGVLIAVFSKITRADSGPEAQRLFRDSFAERRCFLAERLDFVQAVQRVVAGDAVAGEALGELKRPHRGL